MPKADNAQRDALIVQAVRIGRSLEEIVEATGLSEGRIRQIVGPIALVRPADKNAALTALIGEDVEDSDTEEKAEAVVTVRTKRGRTRQATLKTFLLVDGHEHKDEWDAEAKRVRREAYNEAKAAGASYADANVAGLWAVADYYGTELVEVEATSFKKALEAE